jgi:hypothetical protein
MDLVLSVLYVLQIIAERSLLANEPGYIRVCIYAGIMLNLELVGTLSYTGQCFVRFQRAPTASVPSTTSATDPFCKAAMVVQACAFVYLAHYRMFYNALDSIIFGMSVGVGAQCLLHRHDSSLDSMLAGAYLLFVFQTVVVALAVVADFGCVCDCLRSTLKDDV